MERTTSQTPIEEGKEEVQVKATPDIMFDALLMRFPMPIVLMKELNNHILQIEDRSILQQLYDYANKVDSLDDFIRRLNELQGRTGWDETSEIGRIIAQALAKGDEQRAIEKGQVKNAQSSTLDVLTIRFPALHPTLTDLKERVQRIENLSVLQKLHIDAVKVESLDDFVKRLDELQP